MRSSLNDLDNAIAYEENQIWRRHIPHYYKSFKEIPIESSSERIQFIDYIRDFANNPLVALDIGREIVVFEISPQLTMEHKRHLLHSSLSNCFRMLNEDSFVFLSNSGLEICKFNSKSRQLLCFTSGHALDTAEQKIVSGHDDGSLNLWLDGCKCSSSWKNLSPLRCVRFSPNRSVFSMDEDGYLKVWTHNMASPAYQIDLEGQSTCLCFHPDNENVSAIGNVEGTVAVNTSHLMATTESRMIIYDLMIDTTNPVFIHPVVLDKILDGFVLKTNVFVALINTNKIQLFRPNSI
ncbi:hypothetical protein ACOME3_000935 [Neoechinorhynchus agilis]